MVDIINGIFNTKLAEESDFMKDNLGKWFYVYLMHTKDNMQNKYI